MKKRILTLAFLFTALTTMLHAQQPEVLNEMYIGETSGWMLHYPCAIEKASITLAPHGLYTEVGLFLTLGPANTLPSNDSFEVAMNFTLPKGSFIVDSWLWFGDDIVRADITYWGNGNYNTGGGSSLLYRWQDDSYRLRVYPLVNGQTRRIKITYLVPAEWSQEAVTTPLPTEILAAFATPVPNVKIKVTADPIWGTPRLDESIYSLPAAWEETAAGVWEAEFANVSWKDFRKLKLVMDAPLNDGIFVSVVPGEAGTGYYQMALFPKVVLDLPTGKRKKLLVALEHTAGNSSDITKAVLLKEVKLQLLEKLSDQDSFNLVFPDYPATGQTAPYFFRSHWVAAHPDSIHAAFAEMGQMSNNSNLPDQLSQGISFIQNNGGEGEIMLLANSSRLPTYQSADFVLSALRELMGDAVIPIHICDYNYGLGNSYFYDKLVLLTGGNFTNRITYPNFHERIELVFDLPGTAIPGSAAIHTGLENGFISNRYTRSNNHIRNSGLTDLDKPILQVGRMQGNGAFRIKANIGHNGVFESQEILLTEDLSVHSDSMVREMWAGNHLAMLNERSPGRETGAFSIAERVLGSSGIVFVCTSPAFGGETCETCVDERAMGPGTDDPALLAGLSWSTSPNPFTDQLTVKLTLPENIAADDCSMTLFDATGRVVRLFGRQDMSGTGRDWQLVWDARNDNGLPVPAGLYVLVLSTLQGKYHLKVMCAR